MATPIVDLDQFLGADKRVKLRGQTYTLPPDLPVEVYLRIQRAATEGLEEREQVETLYGELLELFRYGDPKIEKLPLGMTQLLIVIPAVYNPDAVDGDAEERPTRTRTRGGKSPTRSNNRPKR